MQKILTICSIACISLIVSCKNTADTNTAPTSTADTSHPAYAYTIDKPDNWEPGNKNNTVLAMKALKAYESNQLDEAVSYFADSVTWKVDSLDTKFSNAGLKAYFADFWKTMTSVKVRMHDFESVVSKDKKDEYVTFWYTEIFTDKKGMVDSMETVNDLKFVNGKIVALNEAIRRFQKK